MTFFKSVIFAMFVAVTVSSIMIALRILPQTAPGFMGVNVLPPEEAKTNPQREDSQYGDFWITDKQARPDGFATEVSDKSIPQQIEFPMGW